MTYRQKLLAELKTIATANADPLAFARKMGIHNTPEYQRGFARGWIEQCVKNAVMYGEILGRQAEAAQMPLEVHA